MEEAGLAVDFYEVRFYLNIDQLDESLINWLINRRHYNEYIIILTSLIIL